MGPQRGWHKFILALIVVTMLILSGSTPTSAPEIPDHVVISEIQIAESEFVELYNPTDSAIDMTGWHWCYYSSGRDWDDPWGERAFPEGATIPAHGFYLIVTHGDVGVSPDWDLSDYGRARLSNTAGSVGIFPWDPKTKTAEEAKAGRIDAVGWDDVENVYEYEHEGGPAKVPLAGQSIERKALYPGYAPCQDTNNNFEDFSIKDMPTPMNSHDEAQPPAPVYGVALTVDQAGRTTEPGAAATYTLTVKNTGNATDSFTLTVENVDDADTAELSADEATGLGPGATQ